uniref:C2H2-type domain-containing protein n=1 Tax=Poecilia formosa TaxID=48698 RepID=A0A087YM23_POEFO
CTTCGKRYYYVKSLVTHMRTHVVKLHSCETCGNEFSSAEALSSHMTEHSLDKLHSCETCGERFYRESSLLTHIRDHSDETSHPCEVCGKRCLTGKALLVHMRSHDSAEKLHSCDVCGKTFPSATLNSFRVNEEKNYKKKEYKCLFFSFKFVQPCWFCLHRGGRGGWSEMGFSCASVGRLPTRRGNSQTQKQQKQSQTIYFCSKHCDFLFRCFTRLSVSRNERVQTDIHPAAPAACQSPGVSCSDQEVSENLPGGDKPSVQCDTCKKVLKSKSYLKVHQRRHTSENPLACSHCDKRFYQMYHLKHHERSDKLYLCKICGRSFSYSTLFRFHMKIHSDEKPLSCETCGKRFRESSKLKRHQRSHTGVKPHRCATCGKGFMANSSLQSHMRINQTARHLEELQKQRSWIFLSNLTVHTRIHTGEEPYSKV